MPKDTSQIVRFSGIPEDIKPYMKSREEHIGKNFTFSNGEWSLNFCDNEKDRERTELVYQQKPIALKGNLDNVANSLCEFLDVRFEHGYESERHFMASLTSRREDLLSSYHIEPDMAKRRFGTVIDMHDAEINLCATATAGVKQVFKETVIPLMTEIFGLKFAVSVRLNVYYLWAINQLAKVHFAMTEMGEESGGKFLEQNYDHGGVDMASGSFFIHMLTSMMKIHDIQIAHPLMRGACAWYFFKEGDSRRPLESMGESYMMIADLDLPRLHRQLVQTRLYGTLYAANMRHDFAKQCIFSSIFCINKLLNYFCDLRNFTTEEQIFDSGKFLKTMSSVRQMQADFGGIASSGNSNTQLILTLTFLDKLTNLVIGISEKKSVAEEIVFGNWVREDRPKIVQALLEKRLTRLHQGFGGALIRSMHQCYDDLRRNLNTGRGQRSDSSTIESRFRELRNINHGTFLRRNTFENLYFEHGTLFPPETLMLPYYLFFGFMVSPKEFAEMMVA